MQIGKYEFDNKKTYIMGILNLTPDSFYDGGSYSNMDETLFAVEKMINDGASIIDVGGESTRPGFTVVPAEEELERVIEPIKKIKERFDIPVSLDTYKAVVAKEAISIGVDIINDVGNCSDDMANVLAKSDVAYCLTHNKDNQYERNEAIYSYDKLYIELNNDLARLAEAGIDESRIILDPGLGFGKSNEDDIMVLKNISKLNEFELPVLIGASNKSCIDYIIPSDRKDRLEGTLAVTAHAFYNNITFVRVHDVLQNARLLKMLESINC